MMSSDRDPSLKQPMLPLDEKADHTIFDVNEAYSSPPAISNTTLGQQLPTPSQAPPKKALHPIFIIRSVLFIDSSIYILPKHKFSSAILTDDG